MRFQKYIEEYIKLGNSKDFLLSRERDISPRNSSGFANTLANYHDPLSPKGKSKKRKRKELLFIEDITLPINVGDTILGGRFKNKRIVVKNIGKNEKGDITINGKPLLKYRLIPKEEQEVETEE